MEDAKFSRPKKTKTAQSKVKTMFTVYFDHKGIVHHGYAPVGQTVNQDYYISDLRRLRDAIRQ